MFKIRPGQRSRRPELGARTPPVVKISRRCPGHQHRHRQPGLDVGVEYPHRQRQRIGRTGQHDAAHPGGRGRSGGKSNFRRLRIAQAACRQHGVASGFEFAQLHPAGGLGETFTEARHHIDHTQPTLGQGGLQADKFARQPRRPSKGPGRRIERKHRPQRGEFGRAQHFGPGQQQFGA